MIEVNNQTEDTVLYIKLFAILLYSMNIWRVLYLANLSFWKFHGYLI